MAKTRTIQFPKELAQELAKYLTEYVAGETIALELKVWKGPKNSKLINIKDLELAQGEKVLAIHLGKGYWLLFREDYIK